MVGTAHYLDLLRCPSCRASKLHGEPGAGTVACRGCGASYPHANGIIDFAGAATALEQTRLEDLRQAHYWEEEEDMYRAFDHEVARGFALQRADFIRRRLPLSEVASAADLGAGNGISTWCLQDDIPTLFSVDMSRRLLRKSPARLKLRADAYQLPFRDKSLDLVYSWELLHHVEEPSTVLAEMGRVSRRYILFFEPNRWNPAQVAFALLSPPDRGTLRNTKRFYVREASKAGLAVIDHAVVGWITPNVPPVWLYRILRLFPFRVPLIGLSHFFLLASS